ncbi:MAG: ComF family protein [Syntrophales bacterium]
MENFLATLVDLLFPVRCVGCDSLIKEGDGGPFCERCISKIHFIKSPICPRCGIPFRAGGSDHLCGECIRTRQYFTMARSVGLYETALLNAIHRFKYGKSTAAGKALGKIMALFDFPGLEMRRFSVIMPVPLHPDRLRERGFNQSLILAREIAGHHCLPLDFTSLKRKRYTEPQIGLGKDARSPNVRGAFEVGGKENISGRKVVLVDDVYTTGSTVRECARTLLGNGAEEVAVLTLARAI